ncbi:hypothetical protein [uncultured Bacteroides sp.]|uniref:hypothetical protein n=1 Tax=uncultured Bacteroides sp. TaxID=162156 RepID=UPI002AA6AA22|nr:hypothetical protein [uncultured Bacteroides sp.]
MKNMKMTKERVYKIADFIMMLVCLSMLLDDNPLLEPVYMLFGIYAPFSIVRNLREVMNKNSES